MINLAYKQTGDGGSIVVKNNDLEIDKGVFTSIYLALFSSVTSFWGNDIFDIDINCKTGNALLSNSLTPEGLENIKRAVESDLKKLKFGIFIVELMQEDFSRLIIKISIEENKDYQAIWDFTKNQLIDFEII